MEHSFLLTKDDLLMICLALEEKIEIFKQVVVDHPEETSYLSDLVELHADLNQELLDYDTPIKEKLKRFGL